MKRPERKDDSEQDSMVKYFGNIEYDRGFNDSYNVWEKFLPGGIEIYDLIIKNSNSSKDDAKSSANAILKRLKGIK